MQKGLFNAVRHASAQRVGLRIEEIVAGASALVSIVIDDDGTGLAGPARQGRGLRGMRERVAALGGVFHIESSAGGTRLAISVPVDRAPAELKSAAKQRDERVTSVLFVDDHPIVLRGCRTVLQDLGVDVMYEATNRHYRANSPWLRLSYWRASLLLSVELAMMRHGLTALTRDRSLRCVDLLPCCFLCPPLPAVLA